jgi:thiamine-phosphate pyrophosphorylase
MSAQLFLIVPPQAAPAETLAALERIATNTEISALLLRRGEMAENAYKAMVKAIAPGAQALGAAVLIEGEPGLVRLLGVDGLHVSGGLKAVRDAVSALKPDMIVGVGDIGSRHDAMQKGELDIDYILFGPLSGDISEPERDLARWWAETMQVPSVLSDPEAGLAGYDAGDCEFIGLALPTGSAA